MKKINKVLKELGQLYDFNQKIKAFRFVTTGSNKPIQEILKLEPLKSLRDGREYEH